MDSKDDTGAFKVPLTNAGAQQQTDAMLKSEPSSNSGLDVGHNIDITMPSTSNPCITHETTGQQQGKRKLDSAEDNCIHPPSGKKLKALKPDELPQALMPTPEQNAESIPVQQPVDPKTLQIPERSVYTCNECKQRVEKRYHCTVCEDYDLCSNCYQKISHNHKMEKLDLEPDVDSDSSSDASCNPQEARRLSIQRCIQSLVHACQCRDANCQLPSCQKMKRLVQHTKVCKRKTNGECPICKQLIALCCYHAKHCQEQICLVPFCLNIKHKLRQRQLQQVQLLRQCMEHAVA